MLVFRGNRELHLNNALTLRTYLGFIHETEYSLEETSWLTTRAQNSWAQGSLTELSAFYNEGKFIFTVLSYNNINKDLNNGVV